VDFVPSRFLAKDSPNFPVGKGREMLMLAALIILVVCLIAEGIP